jgi:hypothetical protein
MPTLQIVLSVPEGTTVEITGLDGVEPAAPVVASDEAVLRYWHALSYNGRKIYAAAARIEQQHGIGYTFEDIAANLSITYESAQSFHRTSGRTAKAWLRDSGETVPPIRLIEIGYPQTATGVGRRARYQLPPSVADLIADLPLIGVEGGES